MSSVWEPVPPINGSNPVPAYGSTAARPTIVPYLYYEYFDTTLGFPVFATQLTGTPIIWVAASGAVS